MLHKFQQFFEFVFQFIDKLLDIPVSCRVRLHRVQWSLVSGFLWHSARDGSDHGSALFGSIGSFVHSRAVWIASFSLPASAARVSQIFWQRWACIVVPMVLPHLSCRDDFLVNGHCSQAASWHTTRDESCTLVQLTPASS